MKEEVDFHFNQILDAPKSISYGQFRSVKKLTGQGGLLAPLIKRLTEAVLEAKVESHIANDVLSGKKNQRNGSIKKTIKGTSDGTFVPQGHFLLSVRAIRNSERP